MWLKQLMHPVTHLTPYAHINTLLTELAEMAILVTH